MMKGRGELTIKDVARLAGVSHSTVSRALNDSPLVNSATKKHIREIADRVGFEFNEGARRMKNRRTGLVGVVYPSVLDEFRVSLYTNELFRDLRHNLEAVGLDALLVEAYRSHDGQSNLARLIRQNKVDGFVIVHPDVRHEDYALIAERHLPLVHVHMHPQNPVMEGVDGFFCDDVLGGHLAAQHLMDVGCQRMATVQIHSPSEESKPRTEGFCQSLQKKGFSSPEIFDCECSYEAGYRLFEQMPEQWLHYDGVFVQADLMAFGFLNAAREHGVSIPQNLKVIGFDDSPVSRMAMPALTTIHQPRERLTEAACHQLHSLLFDEECTSNPHCYFPPELLIRSST
ncbi:MAG: LacI family transcriptional regulator [Spirochaetales bacterium]|nr:LacI family transcriptional regulator [Spirochaetales bacterium]